MLKTSLPLKKFTNSRANTSRILRIKNVKFSGYCFYMNTNMLRDFKICISVPLSVASLQGFWIEVNFLLIHYC